MSDTPKLEEARTALERAHRAAIAMEGGDLRRALEEARDALKGSHAAASARLSEAIDMLDDGPLDRMETVIEEVRTSL